MTLRVFTIADEILDEALLVRSTVKRLRQSREDAILEDIPWLEQSLHEMTNRVGTRIRINENEEGRQPLIETAFWSGLRSYLKLLRSEDVPTKFPDYQRIAAFYSGVSQVLRPLLPYEFVSTESDQCYLLKWHLGSPLSFDSVFEGIPARKIMLHVPGKGIEKTRKLIGMSFEPKARMMAEIDSGLLRWWRAVEKHVLSRDMAFNVIQAS